MGLIILYIYIYVYIYVYIYIYFKKNLTFREVLGLKNEIYQEKEQSKLRKPRGETLLGAGHTATTNIHLSKKLGIIRAKTAFMIPAQA